MIHDDWAELYTIPNVVINILKDITICQSKTIRKRPDIKDKYLIKKSSKVRVVLHRGNI